HELLKTHNLHFGYRVLQEMTTFAGLALERIAGDEEETARTAFDLQLVQKALPKFNGGRELELPLSHLLAFCLDGTPRKTVDAAPLVEEARKRLAVQAVITAEPVAAAPDAEAEGADGDTGADQPLADVAGNESTTSSAAQLPAAYPRASRELA